MQATDTLVCMCAYLPLELNISSSLSIVFFYSDYYFNTEYDAVRRLNFSEPKKMLTARFPNGKQKFILFRFIMCTMKYHCIVSAR